MNIIKNLLLLTLLVAAITSVTFAKAAKVAKTANNKVDADTDTKTGITHTSEKNAAKNKHEARHNGKNHHRFGSSASFRNVDNELTLDTNNKVKSNDKHPRNHSAIPNQLQTLLKTQTHQNDKNNEKSETPPRINSKQLKFPTNDKDDNHHNTKENRVKPLRNPHHFRVKHNQAHDDNSKQSQSKSHLHSHSKENNTQSKSKNEHNHSNRHGHTDANKKKKDSNSHDGGRNVKKDDIRRIVKKQLEEQEKQLKQRQWKHRPSLKNREINEKKTTKPDTQSHKVKSRAYRHKHST